MNDIRLRKIGGGRFLTVGKQKYFDGFAVEVRKFLTPIIIFFAIVGILVFISTRDFTWDSWKASHRFPKGTFCEEVRHGPIRQPMNSWSSLAFIPIGLWAVRRCFLDFGTIARVRQPVRKDRTYGIVFGISMSWESVRGFTTLALHILGSFWMYPECTFSVDFY